VPVLVAHGHEDDDLAFSAGERLRDMMIAAGARVQWLPFEGGHGLPLVVWRALRRFVNALALPPGHQDRPPLADIPETAPPRQATPP
jgi:hypothetical protein